MDSIWGAILGALLLVAVVVLVMSMFAAGSASVSNALLCVINAAVVSLASNGTFDGMYAITGKGGKST